LKIGEKAEKRAEETKPVNQQVHSHKCTELAVVFASNAEIKPLAVMIEIFDANSAFVAVLHSLVDRNIATLAEHFFVVLKPSEC
jgi:hypothetical protein